MEASGQPHALATLHLTSITWEAGWTPEPVWTWQQRDKTLHQVCHSTLYFRISDQLKNLPFTTRCSNTIETMTEMMLVSMVADGTQVIISTLCTFPTNSKYWLLTTCITHCTIMFYTCKTNKFQNCTTWKKYTFVLKFWVLTEYLTHTQSWQCHWIWVYCTVKIYLYFWVFTAHMPVPMAMRSKAHTVFNHSNTGIMGSNAARGMDVSMFFCVGSGLATGWSPVQGVLPNVQK